MDERGSWGHYHKWKRLQKENQELKDLIRTFRTGEDQLKVLEDNLKEKELERKVKAELKKLGLKSNSI